MGCTSSKEAASDIVQKQRSSSAKKQKTPSKLVRCDTDIDMRANIYSQDFFLKEISTISLNRRLFCEEFVDYLRSQNQLHLLSSQDDSSTVKLRKILNDFNLEQLKNSLINNNCNWFIFNNIEAISDPTLKILSSFFSLLLNSPSLKKIIDQSELDRQQSEAKEEELQLGYDQLHKHFFGLNVQAITHPSYFEITTANLFDFELPPGMVTMNEAKKIIELFRAGGRLVPNSVHKLIRLAYTRMKDEPNTSYLNINKEDKLTIVGDLHGQLSDLLLILDNSGLPNENHKYIFNGDFVDRGAYGVEVMCILLALYISCPNNVFLNRGNHEDSLICYSYGFQQECCDKYDSLTFCLFIEMFQHIPLFCVVNNSIFVVHGGLFSHEGLTIPTLDAVDRTKFTLENPEIDLAVVNGASALEHPVLIVQDALWSDPSHHMGITPSLRGAGTGFGYDVARRFLDDNKLNYIIRSHECIPNGYEEPFLRALCPNEDEVEEYIKTPNPNNCLCTIFSASNYGGSEEPASYLEFFLGEPEEGRVCYDPSSLKNPGDINKAHISEVKRICGSDLIYVVNRFYANKLVFKNPDEVKFAQVNRETVQNFDSLVEESFTEILPPPPPVSPPSPTKLSTNTVEFGACLTLRRIIFNRKQILLEEFIKNDIDGTGLVSGSDCIRIISEILNLSITWKNLIILVFDNKSLLNKNTNKPFDERWDGNVNSIIVNYRKFLESFDCEIENYIQHLVENEKHSISEAKKLIEELVKSSSTGVILPKIEDLNRDEMNKLKEYKKFNKYNIPISLVNILYTSYSKLEFIFDYFTKNNEYIMTCEDFILGCKALDLLKENDRLEIINKATNQYYTASEFFSSFLDIYHTNSLSLNIFMELYRLSYMSLNCSNILKSLMSREQSYNQEFHRFTTRAFLNAPTIPANIGIDKPKSDSKLFGTSNFNSVSSNESNPTSSPSDSSLSSPSDSTPVPTKLTSDTIGLSIDL